MQSAGLTLASHGKSPALAWRSAAYLRRVASLSVTTPKPTDWLGELPPELHLRILEGVDDFSDCAAFSIASPRLGLLALRSGLARFKDPLFAVAMRLLLRARNFS
ncbi:hypothetical protein EMIHUDRAFT_235778 [Emiliania huxleyi CCMP1516]|uniref:F-box domain-containing protein n=2 Tax=Emiliania huxleyi TaxID=2903 RepID=A0A0D3JVA8_EMIH1|nr:hypothetical protein EMIHUDRAFT_235778 [Emiliania huxleyi CCMP1516]EOD27443.1 hypothetical protein EMIHUDRAFT_235778 [Emiliania huxleyi CCMP1516]|eukprot:XP_005779872.1 hypothetical protein EMIHUDRAFT_235778 [Emiliania huxleyi CCMP1516]